MIKKRARRRSATADHLTNEDGVRADVDLGNDVAFHAGGHVIDNGVSVQSVTVADAAELIFVLSGKAAANGVLVICKDIDRKGYRRCYERMCAVRPIDDNQKGSRIRAYAANGRCRHSMPVTGMVCRDNRNTGSDVAHDGFEKFAANEIRSTIQFTGSNLRANIIRIREAAAENLQR